SGCAMWASRWPRSPPRRGASPGGRWGWSGASTGTCRGGSVRWGGCARTRRGRAPAWAPPPARPARRGGATAAGGGASGAGAVGGGFGCKIDLSVEHFAAILAVKSGRPVKLVHTREEELAYGTPRHPHRITLTSGVARDGTLVARTALVIQDGGAYSTETPII